MTKISALSDIGTSVASNDTFVLVDVSDPTTPNKKIQQQNLLAAGGLLPDGSAGTPGLSFLSDTNVGLFRPTTDTLAIATGGSERLRIDSSGRLGLGTSSVPYQFSVASNPAATENRIFLYARRTTGANVGIGDWATIGQDAYFGGEYLSGSGWGASVLGLGHITFYTGSSATLDSKTARLTIDNAGRVGIGTTSPTSPLQVGNGTGLQQIYVSSAGSDLLLGPSGGTAFGFSSDTASLVTVPSKSVPLVLGTIPAQPVVFGTGNFERARIDSSGRLLVGTSTASASTRLVVQGSSAGSGSPALQHLCFDGATPASGDGLGFLIFGDNTQSQGAWIAARRDGGTWSASSKPSRLEFSTTADGASSPTERMRISSDGLATFAGSILLNGASYRLFVGGNSNNQSIGTSSVGTGTTTLYIGNAAIQVSSDARLKKDIEDTNLDALDAIGRINVKDFTWDDPTDISPNNRNARGKWTGLIAQELVDVLPFVVNAPRKPDGSIDHESEVRWTLDQSQLCPVLIKAIQQQQEIIAGLEARLSALEAS